MKRLNQLLFMGGVAVLLALSTSSANAQDQQRPGRGNRGSGRGGDFDPSQFRQRMMDRYKEALEVTKDDEWKLISERIEKVTTLQREVRVGGGPGGFRRRGGDSGGDNARPNPFGGEPNPDLEALQKALDSKASPDEIKSKLAKLRESQKKKEADLAKAQDDLRKVLSARQEATAVVMGLLK